MHYLANHQDTAVQLRQHCPLVGEQQHFAAQHLVQPDQQPELDPVPHSQLDVGVGEDSTTVHSLLYVVQEQATHEAIHF